MYILDNISSVTLTFSLGLKKSILKCINEANVACSQQCTFSVRKMVMERMRALSSKQICIVETDLTGIEKLHTVCRTAKRDGVPFLHSFLVLTVLQAAHLYLFLLALYVHKCILS